jgi:hypothetical protein
VERDVVRYRLVICVVDVIVKIGFGVIKRMRRDDDDHHSKYW